MGHFFVTTPIFYVNDVPHIGHAYTTVTADALARWHRLAGDEVFFLTGTDEYGLKIQRAAEDNGRTPQEHADITSARFRETWDLLQITNDDYIRTTEERHRLTVQKLLQRVYDNGFIYSDTYEGPYCVPCEAYYTEAELNDGLCPIHDRPVEEMKEANYFFKLSEFEQPLIDWYEANPEAVGPDVRRNEALGIITQGLRDISITRSSLDWGVPVPWDDDHVFYVWYDALINYATAAGFGSDDDRFAEWWPHVHHLLAKDILRFHCVYWPAMLMAAGLEPPKALSVHGYLQVGGAKMSKTTANQIFPAELVDEFGVDGFRYHFLRDNSFGPDGDFSHEGMLERFNADLANNFGNLVSRVTTVVDKKCDGIGPAPRPDSPLASVAAEVVRDSAAAWEAISPSRALEHTWRLLRETNAFLEANVPWKADPGPEVDAVLGDALEVVRLACILASPAIPNATQAAWERIGLSGQVTDQRIADDAVWGLYPAGLTVAKGDPLFPRLK